MSLLRLFSSSQFLGRLAEDYTLKPWNTIGNLNQARAFASVVTIEIEFNNTIMYILGGYSNDMNFLNSVEKYDKSDSTFTMMNDLELQESKSHFCTLLVEVFIYLFFFSSVSHPSWRIVWIWPIRKTKTKIFKENPKKL